MFVSISILALALECTSQARWLSQRRLALLLVVPVLALLALDLSGPVPVLISNKGPLFWIYLAYTQLVVLIACGLLLASFRTRTLRFGPALILTAGLLIPAVTNWLYVFGLTPVCGCDLTPTTLVVTGVLYLLAFRRFWLFDLMPVAHRAVLEAMDDPVIVLDIQDRMVDANPAAQATCGLPPRAIGASTDSLPPEWAALFRRFPDLSAHQEVSVGPADQVSTYDLTVSPIQDRRRRTVGRLFLLHDITALKQIERELAINKALLEAAFVQMLIPMALVTSPDGMIRIVNPALIDLLGIQDEPSLVGMRLDQLPRSWVGLDRQGNVVPPYQSPLARALAAGTVARNAEWGVRRKDDTIRRSLVSAVLIHNRQGEQIAAHLALPDITSLRQTEAELRKLGTAVEHSAGAIVITDRQGRIEYVNPAFTRITGYTAAEVSGRTPRILKSGRQPPECYQEMWITILSGREMQEELLNRKKNGDLYWEHTLIAPITDPTGTITHFVAIKEDVTAPKRAEEALQMAKAELEMKVSEQTAALREVNRQLMDELDLRKQAEQRFRTLFEEAPVMYVITHNQEGLPVIADCNRMFPSVMGYDKAEVLGRALADSYTPSSRAKLESGGYQSALENRFTVEERQLVTRQGPIIETVLQAVPEIDAQGQTVGTRAMYVDITGRRKAERMFQGLLEAAPDAMVIARQDGEIVLVNAQAERLLGYGREELVGQSHRILHSELARSGQVGELARSFSSPNTRLPGTRLELQARRRDCSEFPVDVSLSPLETGEGLLISAAIPDASQRKATEQAIGDSETTMRALAWRLADARESERKDLARELHDRVGQNLTALDLYLSTIRGQLPEADPCAAQIQDRLDASLALLAQTAERIRDVMADLRPPVLDDWGLVAPLEWHASRCATDYGIAIAVEGQEPGPPPTAPVALALFRIAQEALNNVSRHARASRVTVSVEPGPDGQAVRLVVADDRVGFEVRERTRPTGG